MDASPDPAPLDPGIAQLVFARRQRVRMAATVSLVGVVLCIGAVAFRRPDALSSLWILNFGAILCATPYLLMRYLLWRCPECGLRLEWHLADGRCGSCQAQLETPPPASPG